MVDETDKPEFDDELTESLSDGSTDASPTQTMADNDVLRTARQIGPYRRDG